METLWPPLLTLTLLSAISHYLSVCLSVLQTQSGINISSTKAFYLNLFHKNDVILVIRQLRAMGKGKGLGGGVGEGCDGGSIPTRLELVKQKQEAEQAPASDVARTHATCCSLSSLPLRSPVVVCCLGRLYNKEEMLEAMVSGKLKGREEFEHIKSLRDLSEAKLTPNPQFVGELESQGGGGFVCPFLCPVSKVEFNGVHSFLFLKPCGHVVSERVIREIIDFACPVCDTPFLSLDNTLPIYPNEETLQKLKEDLKEKKEKESKKRKKKEKSTKSSKRPKHEHTSELNPLPTSSSSSSFSSSSSSKQNGSAVYQSLFIKKTPGNGLEELTFTSTTSKGALGLL